MTNWMSALLAARLERIAGIATFTIETSSSTMNSAVITLASASQRRGSSSLAGGAGVGGCAPAPGADTASVVSVIRRASHDRASGPYHSPAVAEVHLARVPSGAGTREARRSSARERPVQRGMDNPHREHREHGGDVVAPDASPGVPLRTRKTAARERGQDEQADRRRPGPDADLLARGKVGAGDRRQAMCDPRHRGDGAEPVVSAEPSHREAPS